MDAKAAESLLKFGESIGPGLRGAEAKALFDQVDQQYGDLRSAIDWFADQGRADEALRLAISLTSFWMSTQRLDEGSTCFDRVLALRGGDESNRGRALFHAGYLAFWKGDDERSASLQNRAVEVGRRTKDPTVAALALVGLARIALRNDVERARNLCREALAITEGTDDRAGRSSAMHVLGVAAQMAGDFPEARHVMSQRIALAREMGDLVTVSSEAGNLSMVERQLGNLEAAEALAREALEIDCQRGDAWAMPYKVSGIAAIAADRGELERAAILIGAAESMMSAQGAAWPPDELVQYERTMAALIESMGSAEFERARASGRSMTAPEAVSLGLGTGSAG